MRHDGNSVLEWCVGNVVGKVYRRDKFDPTRQRLEQEIDAAVAMMMAVGRAMAGDDAQNLSFQSGPLIAA
jgi:phage terminase large subunit-like protein